MLSYFIIILRKEIPMNDERKIISVRVEPELHKKLKILAIEKNTTLQDYIIELIKRDMVCYEEERKKG